MEEVAVKLFYVTFNTVEGTQTAGPFFTDGDARSFAIGAFAVPGTIKVEDVTKGYDQFGRVV